MGERLELHVLFSNGVGDIAGAGLRWQLATTDGRVLLTGEQLAPPLRAGQVQEVGLISGLMPALDPARPHTLTLWVELELENGAPIRNQWSLWAVPPATLPPVVAVGGTLAYHHHLARLDRNARFVVPSESKPGTPLLTNVLDDRLLDWVAQGGHAVLWQAQPDDRFTRTLPFWREAIHAFEPHPLWDRVPQAGYADMRFFSVANDVATDLPALSSLLGPSAHARPVWRRFDARSLFWAEYLVDVEFGAGRLWVSSLRFEGGQGRQPDGFDTNPLGAWLLATLLAPSA
jgi:hypothetical protein